MSLFNRKNNNNDTQQQQQQDDDNSIYSNTSSVMSTSSRISKIPNAVKSSMKYLVRRGNKNSKSNNKEVVVIPEQPTAANKLKRHTSTLVHFGNLFNRQTKDKSVMPTSTTSSTLYQKSIDPSLSDIKSKRRNSSVVTLASRFLHTTTNKDSTLQHHDDEISSSKPTVESTITTGSELLESQVEEYLVEEQCDSKSEITYKPKREEPWTRQRAKSCQVKLYMYLYKYTYV